MIKRAVNVIVSLAVIFTAFFPLTIFAQEEETSEVDDNYFIPREAYLAYKFFELGGYKAGATVLEERQILKSELVSSGDLTLSGDGTATFTVTLDSVTTDDGSTITINETTDLAGTLGTGYQTANSSTYITVPALTFKTVNTTNNYSTVSNTIACNKTGTYGTWTGNTSGTQGTITYPNYSCTFSPYEKTTSDSIRLDAQNLNFSLSQRQITGTNTTTGEEVINLDIDTSGSITGTLTFDLEGTLDFDTAGNITNDIEHEWIYNYPLMIRDGGTKEVTTSAVYYDPVLKGYPIYISFISSNTPNANDFIVTNYTGNLQRTTIYNVLLTGFNKRTVLLLFDQYNYGLKITPYNAYNYIPLYFGNGSDIDDNYANYIGIKNITQNILESGNTNSQTVENNTDTTNTQLIGTSGQYTNIENQFNNNFTNAINNLNISDTLTSNQKFASSANWVRVQFNRIVNSTPFESVIAFCLIIGFALIMIGKVRR